MQKTIDYCFFNGDADGICSALQFLMSGHEIKNFVTGPKRSHDLIQVSQVELSNLNIVACDIELDKNFSHVLTALQNSCLIKWFDHHGSQDIENKLCEYKNFISYIDTSRDTNTSLIVFNYIKNIKLIKWVIVGLFGDNIRNTALNYCHRLNLSEDEIYQLSEIGELINYNSYGENIESLLINPIEILNELKNFEEPILFYNEAQIIHSIKKQYLEDFETAKNYLTNNSNIILLPNANWSRRIYGIFGNWLLRTNKNCIFAILVEFDQEHYMVSIRSSSDKLLDVGSFCRKFETGGGRKIAGGINKLPKSQFQNFEREFLKFS